MKINFENGKSNLGFEIKNNLIIKRIKENNQYITILKAILSDENLKQLIPNYLELNSKFISYKPIRGRTLKKVKSLSFRNLKILALFLKEFNDKTDFKYIHGDISPTNLIFNIFLKIKKIIDWDSLQTNIYFKHYDLFFTIWTCVNIGSNRFRKLKIKKINYFLKYYNFNFDKYNVIDGFDKIFEYYEQKSKKENNYEFNKIQKWINDSRKFILENQNKIKKC